MCGRKFRTCETSASVDHERQWLTSYNGLAGRWQRRPDFQVEHIVLTIKGERFDEPTLADQNNMEASKKDEILDNGIPAKYILCSFRLDPTFIQKKGLASRKRTVSRFWKSRRGLNLSEISSPLNNSRTRVETWPYLVQGEIDYALCSDHCFIWNDQAGLS